MEEMFETQLSELGSAERALEQEISQLPTLIREAARSGNEPEADRLEARLRQAREELKSIQLDIRSIEASLYTYRRGKNRDRSR